MLDYWLGIMKLYSLFNSEIYYSTKDISCKKSYHATVKLLSEVGNEYNNNILIV